MTANQAISDWRNQGRSRELTVGDIMSTTLLSCSPETPVAQAAARMSEQRNSSILVRQGDAILGIWTEYDALSQGFADDDFDTPIADVMSSPVATVARDTSVSEAAVEFKRRGFRHYVVLDPSERPCGLITQSDLVINHGVEWFMRLQPVRTALTGEPPVVDTGISLSQAATRMHASRQDALILYGPDGEPGILTERDVVRYIGERQGDIEAWRIATRPLQTVERTASLFHARNIMLERSIRHLGVTDASGALEGLIGFTTILETIEHGYIEELELALAERDSELQASEQRYRALVELSPDAIAVHRDRYIQFINPAGARLLGATSPQQVTGRRFDEFVNADAATTITALACLEQDQVSVPHEQELIRLDGRRIQVELSACSITYSNESAWQIVMRDITRRKDLEHELRRLATTDPLTGIVNRQHFETHLDQAVRESARYGQPFSLIMLDLDHFKTVNDAHGHDAGDRVLQDIVARIEASLRDTDVFGRWGGEEFMILAPHTDATGAQQLADKLRRTLHGAALAQIAPVTASFGTARHSPPEGREHLLKRVDDALYRAKGAGRDRVELAE